MRTPTCSAGRACYLVHPPPAPCCTSRCAALETEEGSMSRFRTSLLCFPVMLLLPACASRSPNGAGSRCELTASDSSFALAGPVYRDCAVDRRARLIDRGQLRLDYRPSGTPTNACYSAEIEFVVDTEGRPEIRTARVLRASEQALGTAVLQSLPQWRYAPAQKDGVPV